MASEQRRRTPNLQRCRNASKIARSPSQPFTQTALDHRPIVVLTIDGGFSAKISVKCVNFLLPLSRVRSRHRYNDNNNTAASGEQPAVSHTQQTDAIPAAVAFLTTPFLPRFSRHANSNSVSRRRLAWQVPVLCVPTGSKLGLPLVPYRPIRPLSKGWCATVVSDCLLSVDCWAVMAKSANLKSQILQI